MTKNYKKTIEEHKINEHLKQENKCRTHRLPCSEAESTKLP